MAEGVPLAHVSFSFVLSAVLGVEPRALVMQCSALLLSELHSNHS